MATKIVVIGAGSATFGFGVLGDVFRNQTLQGSSVVLHDINPTALQKVEQVARQFMEAHDLQYTLSATTSRSEALQGADFCIISIEVGNRFELWEQDWRIPQQYGNRQVYGENGGPGGLFHSLRIIPPILEICEDIQRICPQAYIFNLSNPMSRICLAVHRRYPDLRFIGLCHEIAELPEILHGILGVPFAQLESKSGGLNHFTILQQLRYAESGKDAYPDLRCKAADYLATLPALTDTLREHRSAGGNAAEFKGRLWSDRWLVKIILERFGYLPITVDSHFGEYIHWAQDVVDHRSILDFYNWYKEWSFTHAPEITLEGTADRERVIPIIAGILTDSGHEELAVNIPNNGLIENLPQDLVVEAPARIDKGGVHGISLGLFPKGIAGLLNNQATVQDLSVEAALTGSREIALQALLVDPVVDSFRSAEQILDTMLDMQSSYLAYIQ